MIELACRYDKAGAHRRELGQPRPGPAGADDGRERAARRAARFGRHDARGDGRVRPGIGCEGRRTGPPADRIILSCKVSGVQDLIAIYRSLSAKSDYALHLGLTEAGMGSKGIVASTAAMGVLLQEGIGDTIRVSLTPEPGGSRTQEVIVAQEMLQTMGLRAFTPMVTACPGCGRTTSTFFQELAQTIQEHRARQDAAMARSSTTAPRT